jgi:hypothetical protein
MLPFFFWGKERGFVSFAASVHFSLLVVYTEE